MSEDANTKSRDIVAEFERLGLNMRDLPFVAHSTDPEQFLERLRAMQPGVTWRDVLPDLPKEFVPGRLETWPRKYHPFGPYDYPKPPAGPAVHIKFEGRNNPERFDTFVTKAKQAGWRVYGAGLIPIDNPEWTTLDGFIILEHETTRETLGEFYFWMKEQMDVHYCGTPRNVSEDQHYNA